MSRFDDEGMFWLPETYKRAERERASARDKAPRVLPPIPETGWEPSYDFPDLSAARWIGFDTETFDPDLKEKGPGCRRDGYICGISLATDDGWARYYPLRHSMGKNLDPVPVYQYVREQLSRSKQPKVGANALYDLDFLRVAGIEVAGSIYDVQYADPLLDEYQFSYSLERIAQRRLGEGKETSLLYQWCADAYGGNPTGEQRANIWRSPSELVGPYAEQDALLPIAIIAKQIKELRERGMVHILRLECSLIPLLLQMRSTGVRVDNEHLAEVDRNLTATIERLDKELGGISVFAPGEIQRICDAEGILYPLTEKKKQASFTKEWLEKQTHPKLVAVAAMRKFLKLRDTFARSSMRDSQINGRVHCTFHPLRSDDYGTVSGRFSSSDPNLQQIPSRDPEWGPLLRGCFIPDDDLLWVKLDLSQIEFRLGVHFGVGRGIEEVRSEYRRNHKLSFYKLAQSMTGLEYVPAKSLSLGTLYGMGLPKFARMIGKDIDTTRLIFKQYNDRLPFMRATYDATAKYAEETGTVTTIGGRVCGIQKGFEHKALNRKLQGSCADWIKRTMLEAHEAGLFDVLVLYLTVHDELDVGVPRTPAGVEALQELHRIMVNAYILNIPVLAGMDVGPSWGDGTDCEPENLSKIILGN